MYRTRTLGLTRVPTWHICYYRKLRPQSFKWIGFLVGESQWFQSLFRRKIATLNFSMEFNIIFPYMDCVHINRSLHQWSPDHVLWAVTQYFLLWYVVDNGFGTLGYQCYGKPFEGSRGSWPVQMTKGWGGVGVSLSAHWEKEERQDHPWSSPPINYVKYAKYAKPQHPLPNLVPFCRLERFFPELRTSKRETFWLSFFSQFPKSKYGNSNFTLYCYRINQYSTHLCVE